MLEKIIDAVLSVFPKTRKSNPLSKLLRPIFEAKKIKAYLGLQIAGAAIFAGVVTYPTQEFDYGTTEVAYIDAGVEQVVETEETFQFPLTDYYGVSQWYSYYHPAYDIRAPKGASVQPVADGVIVEKEMGVYGYGHQVVVDHKYGYRTRYAHLGNVYAEVGQEVQKETVIGEIGLTGWTTGYHLHFEVMREGKNINPSEILR